MAATINNSRMAKDVGRPRVSAVDRDRNDDVVGLVLGGASVGEIGAMYGISTRAAMQRMVERVLRTHLIEIDPGLRRRVREARLDALLHVWWDKALAGDPTAASVVISVIELSHHLDRGGS
jgi:hypothetical protein